jgi:hypothetical protein
VKVIIAAILAMSLFSGCSTFTRKEVVVETKYVVRQASAAQKSLPPYPAGIDVKSANQLDLAKWITENEERQMRLERIIEELIKFYEKAPTKEETEKQGK